MTEKTDTDSVGAALLDWDGGLQKYRRGPRSVGVSLHVPDIWHRRSGQTSGAGRQVYQGGVRPQKRAPDYPVVAAWTSFLVFIAAGTFALGMAIHNEALAKQHTQRPEPIYYDDSYLDGLARAGVMKSMKVNDLSAGCLVKQPIESKDGRIVGRGMTSL
jgi:hypothetical protein